MRSSALVLLAFGLAASSPLQSSSDVGEPLLLTPLIESNRLDEARQVSKVNYGPLNEIAASYTGFITVNKEYNSNIYFWYVPAKVSLKKRSHTGSVDCKGRYMELFQAGLAG